MRGTRALSFACVTAAVLGTVLWCAHRAVGFGGQTIVADFRHPARFVGDLKPVGRRDDPVRESGAWRTRLTSSPVFVDFSPLARFYALRVEAAFVPGDADEVVVGALTHAASGQFVPRSVYHAGLESLAAAGWTARTEDGMTLYQRVPKFSSVADFMGRPPAAREVATYRVPSVKADLPAGGVAGPATFSVVLRGSHRFVTLVDDGTLDVAFDLQDMNREDGADVVALLVAPLAGGPAVASVGLQDDENDRDDQVATGLRPLRATAQVPNGVYRVDLQTTDDVFVREIRVGHRRFAALDRVFVGDYIGYSDRVPATALVTDASELSLTGPHAESAQTARVGTEAWEVGGGYAEAVRGRLGIASTAVTVPKADVIVEGNGQFAFAPGGLVPGLPFAVGALTTPADLAARGISSVLAAYVPPSCASGACEGAASFVFSEMGRAPTGAYRVSVDVPALRVRDAARGDAPRAFSLESLAFVTERAPRGVLATLLGLPGILREPERFAVEPPLPRAMYEAID
jgi:hypothetical protein